jgi:thioredoxin
MKRNIITFGAGIVFMILAGTLYLFGKSSADPAKREVSIVEENKTKNSNMEKLSKETFLEKVFNYEQNKEWKYEGELPCLIDFYADWCGPCKMVHPILEELSKEYEGKIKIYQIDTEVEQELAAAFGIRSIPSLLFCPADGQPQMAQGALPKASLKKAIEEILLAENPAEVEK